MGLVKKINMALISLFLTGLFLSVFIFYRAEFKRAKEETVSQAELILKTALAVREYTMNEIWPLLESSDGDTFLPQRVPAYAAKNIFNILRRYYPDYKYREVAINPINRADRSNEWETDIIQNYQNNPDLYKMIHIREKNKEEMLYISSAIKIENSMCLGCHNNGNTVPASVVNTYGKVNATGWDVNNTIGALFVSLPMTVPKQKAKASIFNMLISFITIFIFIFMTINFIFAKWIMKPMSEIARVAKNISLKKNTAEKFPAVNNKEMQSIVNSMERMRASLKQSMRVISDYEAINGDLNGEKADS